MSDHPGPSIGQPFIAFFGLSVGTTSFDDSARSLGFFWQLQLWSIKLHAQRHQLWQAQHGGRWVASGSVSLVVMMCVCVSSMCITCDVVRCFKIFLCVCYFFQGLDGMNDYGKLACF